MLSFKEYVLSEALVTFGGKAYPKFNNIVILAGGAGCLSKGTGVLLYDGSIKPVENVSVGDLLMGPDSSPRTVIDTITGKQEMIKVYARNELVYTCNRDHIHSFICSFDKCGFKKGEVYNLSYDQWLDIPDSAKKALKLYKSEAIDFSEKSLPIDPYVLGVWLGDGCRRNTNIVIDNKNDSLVDRIQENLEDGVNFNKIKSDKINCSTWTISGNKGKYRKYLVEHCGGENKRIPFEFLTSSIDQRKRLLEGLIDSDGYNGGKYYEILTKFNSLKNDIVYLCRSLGYHTNVSIKTVKWNNEDREYYRIFISGNFDDLDMAVDYKNSECRKQIKYVNRYGYFFDLIEEDEYFGFSLAEDDKRFLLSNFFVTHNSGKGFITDKLLGIEGRVLDVDEVKKLVMKSDDIAKRVRKELGVDVTKLNLRNPSDVKMLHAIVADELDMINKRERAFISSVMSADPSRKPNIVFDVTLKDLKKFNKIMKLASTMGYETKNIHIVWIANHIDVAMQQNKDRARVVPEDILVATHEGASDTVSHLVNVGSSLGSIGDFHIVFNQIGVDADVRFGDKKEVDRFGTGNKKNTRGFYIKDANYITVKKAGSSKIELDSQSIQKIQSYVPNPESWDNTTSSGPSNTRKKLKDFSKK